HCQQRQGALIGSLTRISESERRVEMPCGIVVLAPFGRECTQETMGSEQGKWLAGITGVPECLFLLYGCITDTPRGVVKAGPERTSLGLTDDSTAAGEQSFIGYEPSASAR